MLRDPRLHLREADVHARIERPVEPPAPAQRALHQLVHQREIARLGSAARVRAIQQAVAERAARVDRLQDAQRGLARIARQRRHLPGFVTHFTPGQAPAALLARFGRPPVHDAPRPAIATAIRRTVRIDRARTIDRVRLSAFERAGRRLNAIARRSAGAWRSIAVARRSARTWRTTRARSLRRSAGSWRLIAVARRSAGTWRTTRARSLRRPVVAGAAPARRTAIAVHAGTRGSLTKRSPG